MDKLLAAEHERRARHDHRGGERRQDGNHAAQRAQAREKQDARSRRRRPAKAAWPREDRRGKAVGLVLEIEQNRPLDRKPVELAGDGGGVGHAAQRQHGRPAVALPDQQRIHLEREARAVQGRALDQRHASSRPRCPQRRARTGRGGRAVRPAPAANSRAGSPAPVSPPGGRAASRGSAGRSRESRILAASRCASAPCSACADGSLARQRGLGIRGVHDHEMAHVGRADGPAQLLVQALLACRNRVQAR